MTEPASFSDNTGFDLLDIMVGDPALEPLLDLFDVLVVHISRIGVAHFVDQDLIRQLNC